MFEQQVAPYVHKSVKYRLDEVINGFYLRKISEMVDAIIKNESKWCNHMYFPRQRSIKSKNMVKLQNSADAINILNGITKTKNLKQQLKARL